jgi:predicted nucleotidyltransferase
MPELREILDEFRHGLEQIYGPRLVRMILFGSHARGVARPDSDIDVLLVLRGPVDVNEEIRRVSPLASELSLRADVVISCVYVSEEEFQADGSPLILNIRKEGLAA